MEPQDVGRPPRMPTSIRGGIISGGKWLVQKLLTGKGFAAFATVATVVGSVAAASTLSTLPSPSPSALIQPTPLIIYVPIPVSSIGPNFLPGESTPPIAPPTYPPIPTYPPFPTYPPYPTAPITVPTLPPVPIPTCFHPGKHRGIDACMFPH